MSHYLRVKGEAEQAVSALGFATVIIVRPSLLLDDRPTRPAEQAIVTLSRWLAPVLGWLPSRGIEVSVLARAMTVLARAPSPGVRIVENAELHSIGG